MNPDQRLADNGNTLAHVTEQLVIVAHYVTAHGPIGVTRPPIERCQIEPCPTWRRYLASRLP